MTGLVFVQPDNSNQSTDLIASNVFWPSISIKKYRESTNVDSNVPESRVRMVLIEAIATVNAELKAFRLDAIQNGFTALADIDADNQIDGISVHVHRYTHAVHCHAHVSILEQYSTYSATGHTADRADAKQAQANDYRRNAHAAIADILGAQRCDSELI